MEGFFEAAGLADSFVFAVLPDRSYQPFRPVGFEDVGQRIGEIV